MIEGINEGMIECIDALMARLTKLSINQPTNPLTTQENTNQAIGRPTNLPMNETAFRHIKPYNNQPTNQSTNRPTKSNQSRQQINQSTDRATKTTNPSIKRSINQSIY